MHNRYGDIKKFITDANELKGVFSLSCSWIK